MMGPETTMERERLQGDSDRCCAQVMSACTECGALATSSPTAGLDLGAGLKSLWGGADPDLRLCPLCGDWFVWSTGVAPNAQVLTRIARPAALVMEELLSGTSRPREAIDQAKTLVEESLFAALIDHLTDDAFAPLLERFVEWLPTARGVVGNALLVRLEAAARTPRFKGALLSLLDAGPTSDLRLHLLTTCLEAGTTVSSPRRPSPLSAEELADFWALDVPLEAEWVSDGEWRRAISESRAQAVSSYSSMGTAETGWVRVFTPTTSKADAAVVPPGRTAQHTAPHDMADDRDSIGVCWSGFWWGQLHSAARHVKGAQQRYVFAECTRTLREFERTWPTKSDGAWLDEAGLPSAAFERELAAPDPYNKVWSARARLVPGLRAKWLTGDLFAALELVLVTAAGPDKRWDRHGDLTRQAAVRMELLRFIVRLVRR